MSSTWWHIPALTATIGALSYALYQFTQEPESVKQKRHAIHLLSEVQNITDAVLVRLNGLEKDAKLYSDQEETKDEENDVPLNSYYHFDSTGKKLKTKWDNYDVDAELERLDNEGDDQPSAPATKPKTKPTKSQLLRRACEMEHEFEAILSYLDTVRGDEEVRVVRKQIVGSINDTYLTRLDKIKADLQK